MLSASFFENRFFAALFSVSSQLQKLCPIRISCRNAVSTVCPLAVSLTHRPAAHLKPEAKNRLLPTTIHCSLNHLPCQEENEARLEGPSGRARNTKVKGDPLDIARPACPPRTQTVFATTSLEKEIPKAYPRSRKTRSAMLNHSMPNHHSLAPSLLGNPIGIFKPSSRHRPENAAADVREVGHTARLHRGDSSGI